MTSFRDPRLTETLDVCRRVRDYVAAAPWDQDAINRGIIGVAKHDEKPLRPAELTATALRHHSIGETLATRSLWRQRLLAATPDKVRQALLEALENGLPRASVCVMASRARLEQARAQLPGLTITDVLK